LFAPSLKKLLYEKFVFADFTLFETKAQYGNGGLRGARLCPYKIKTYQKPNPTAAEESNFNMSQRQGSAII